MVQQRLLDGDGPPAKVRKIKKDSDNAVGRLWTLFCEEYQSQSPFFAHCDLEYKSLAYSREKKHLKDMLAAWGEDDVAQTIRVFFRSTDPEVTRRNYTVADLFFLAQRLRVHGNGRVDKRTRDNIDAAARAVKRG